jgi:hypothetical protein
MERGDYARWCRGQRRWQYLGDMRVAHTAEALLGTWASPPTLAPLQGGETTLLLPSAVEVFLRDGGHAFVYDDGVDARVWEGPPPATTGGEYRGEDRCLPALPLTAL